MSLFDLIKIRLFGAPMRDGKMPLVGDSPDATTDEKMSVGGTGGRIGDDNGKGTELNAGALESQAEQKPWPERVLFVCSGNICRSAYGAVKLRQLAEENGRVVRIASCGILRLVGHKAAPEMIETARERGLDLESHRSCAITRRLAEVSDVIFAMEPVHKKEICRICPEASGKTILLGSYLDRPSVVIPDPMGRAPEAYRVAANQIDEALTLWVRSFPPP